MPAYTRPEVGKTVELRLPTSPECVVTMKERADYGDILDAEDYYAATGKTNDFYKALTLALIVDWNLEDESGEKWPIDQIDSLRRLDPDDGRFLEGEARNRAGRRKDEAPFVKPSGRGSKATK